MFIYFCYFEFYLQHFVFSYITKVSFNEMNVFLTISDMLITFNWYINIIVISKWWNTWDARSEMIDHDNCNHSGFEMRCEISNDWSW